MPQTGQLRHCALALSEQQGILVSLGFVRVPMAFLSVKVDIGITASTSRWILFILWSVALERGLHLDQGVSATFRDFRHHEAPTLFQGATNTDAASIRIDGFGLSRMDIGDCAFRVGSLSRSKETE